MAAPRRTLDVAPERLERWVAGFAARHGPARFEIETTPDGDVLVLTAADLAVARFEPPYPPWSAAGSSAAGSSAAASAIARSPQQHDHVQSLAAHALAPRVVGVLLVRLGGFAAGVFDGADLVASKVGSRPVHGRSAAGGWSQQRFARRREGQVRIALSAAAQAACDVVLPQLSRLDAVVTGGDRKAIDTVLAQPALRPLTPLVVDRVLDVGDPKAAVLRQSLAACRAIRVELREPDSVAATDS